MREREVPRTQWQLNGRYSDSQEDFDRALAAWQARRARLLALVQNKYGSWDADDVGSDQSDL